MSDLQVINAVNGDPNDILTFICPHCQGDIQVLRSETNCCIFRHGQFRKNGQQVPPHLSKEECDDLFEKEAVWGCCKPFRILIMDNKWVIDKCDYI